MQSKPSDLRVYPAEMSESLAARILRFRCDAQHILAA
jgi:hypothetical protein